MSRLLGSLALGLFTLSSAAVSQDFGSPVAVSASSMAANSVATGDFDQDGDLDIVTASYGNTTIAWHENLGQWAFGSAQILSTNSAESRSVTVADIDADGDEDIVFCGHTHVRWLENLGAGIFASEAVISSYNQAVWLEVEVADIDGDQALDVASVDAAGRIWWWPGLGSGQFGAPNEVANVGGHPDGLCVADLDGDGDVDFVVSHRDSQELAWYRNDGQPTDWNRTVFDAGLVYFGPVFAGDIDSDGDLDIAAGASGFMGWYENDGSGGLGPRQSVWTSGWPGLADLDQDGDLDMFGTSSGTTSFWFENLGLQGFSGPQAFASPGGSIRLAADLDGDGDQDLLFHGQPWVQENLIFRDCNGNGVHDPIDVSNGTSQDCDGDSVPDECEADCNANGLVDDCEVIFGSETDCDGDGVMDSCQIGADPSLDWDGNGAVDSCSGEPTYCVGNVNAVGAVGEVLLSGSPVLADNDLTLSVTGLPQAVPAYFVFSANAGYSNPFGGGNGVLCLGAPIRRFNPFTGYSVLFSSAAGEVSFSPDLSNLPMPGALQPGDTLHFQLWHREFDAATGGMTSNTSSAVRILFR
jgi:hypothetical protein